MLDEDEGDADAGGQRVDEFPAGAKAARRGADPDDRKVARLERAGARRRGTPTRSRPGRFGVWRTICWQSMFVLSAMTPVTGT